MKFLCTSLQQNLCICVVKNIHQKQSDCCPLKGHCEATGKPYQDFIVWHSVCSQAIAVKGDAIGGSTGVYGIDLPSEQAIMDTSKSSW